LEGVQRKSREEASARRGVGNNSIPIQEVERITGTQERAEEPAEKEVPRFLMKIAEGRGGGKAKGRNAMGKKKKLEEGRPEKDHRNSDNVDSTREEEN